ncbi:anaerobic benzoate catabolism transcriptional regulator [Slackia heliotrinireducens]|jgi:transcriptional regulator with XRE-family HTH domain|uniref:Predicted transcriptional regulator n=1 Tax=Slackia heliotrinireducens (strain ATCC 29202 / DSM 20476 / NCTC 11029 / RHS 1) TaxID=471855 RepID=C7N4S0_SLAHD|nr:helix-turn-helix transcriptional regulator [Slackia heliotrinireducens]ACV21905.1 predicted transcriptional regulator [Slackia heliotrinireducens DSM 20476]VEG99708.1 anaerobic benzoate catabolism transcriptional regulator [Slackia heliotrinireducens]
MTEKFVEHIESKRKLGVRIAKLREEKGMSQRRLALVLELDRVTLNRIESGTANPTISTLMRIADGLDVAFEELFHY